MGFMLSQQKHVVGVMSQQIMCRIAILCIIQCHYTPTSYKVKMHTLQTYMSIYFLLEYQHTIHPL